MMMAADEIMRDHNLAGLLAGMTDRADVAPVSIHGLAGHSDEVRPGDLFFACAGQHVHGLRHVRQAIAAGAVAVVWEPVPGQGDLAAIAASLEVPAVAVRQLGYVKGVIADRFYGHPSHGLFVIGITGTDGKTSCSHFIAQALDAPGRRCGVVGTLGYGLYGELAPGGHTTPDALVLHRQLAIMQNHGARCVVCEVSSHGIDQGRVSGVDLDVAVLTNVTRDHIDYHGDPDTYAAAKRRLFHAPGLRYAVLNGDDAFGRALAADMPANVAPVVYSLCEGSADLGRPVLKVFARDVRLDENGIAMAVVTPWGEGRIRCDLLGRFNAGNLLAALAVLCVSGLPLEEATRRLSLTQTVPGRMERFGGGDRRPLVVVDYAHTPGALEQVLVSLRAHCRGRLWCVFGAGGDRDRGKRGLMGAAVQRFADHVVITDDNPRSEDPAVIAADILGGMDRPGSAVVEHDRRSAIALAIGTAREGDVVLVAGKGHEQVQTAGESSLPFSDSEEVIALLQGDTP
jgi:UDP-N-acetylmuramoyl-L-alanyl-D-glutamate--2,6-diaminopimelate ligase